MMSSVSRLRVSAPIALLLLAGMLALSHPAGASTRTAASTQAASTRGAAGSGNLLVNPNATAGDVSAQGWDAVTIPGWQVAAGLPTVVRYGTSGFPTAEGAWPASRGQVFAGGAGGTARLTQSLSLLLPSGKTPPNGTRYQLSAWLGGTRTSWAELTVRFLGANSHQLASRTIGPVGRTRHATFAPRSATGVLPAGTESAQVTIVLATSLSNFNGPDAPQTGYNRAVAADLGFTVSVPAVRPAKLTPPAAQVPSYQHVFLFYFENEDLNEVIGNTKQAPYLNGLLRQGTLLSQFYAEEHPSDGNYLALAGGSTFGVPLDDPEEENPQYTIQAPNIGDLVDGAHETWKAYMQSANGPCDDTVHTYYWNDDQPMLYFADVRDRPAYCADHVVPLASLQSDLASADTTPNFAWVAPDDCSDMEGCGIAAGDAFLAKELGEIMASPAWLIQRSLAIITFDEDAQDYQHPAQRVPTIILGSDGVRAGYTSSVRYTHYSLLRTIEAALGLGTLTANDRYAQPLNDVFGPDTDSAPARAASLTSAHLPAQAKQAQQVQQATPTTPHQPTAWVANYGSATVTPVNLSTRKAGHAIDVGADPDAIVVTPNGRTVYVASAGSGTVTPIAAATGRAGSPIRTGGDRPGHAVPVGYSPVAITTGGTTAYVVNSISGTLTPLAAASGKPGAPISVGLYSYPTAVTLYGSTAVVLDTYAGQVSLVNTRTRHVYAPITAGDFPVAVAISG